MKSWACLYEMSSVGVNLFLCSSSRSGRNTLQGFSVCHSFAFLWSRHRQSCKESVRFLKAPALLALQAIQKLAYRTSCIRPDKKTLHPLGMEKDLPPRALVRQEARVHRA
jgi:hypothetical protein